MQRPERELVDRPLHRRPAGFAQALGPRPPRSPARGWPARCRSARHGHASGCDAPPAGPGNEPRRAAPRHHPSQRRRGGRNGEYVAEPEVEQALATNGDAPANTAGTRCCPATTTVPLTRTRSTEESGTGRPCRGRHARRAPAPRTAAHPGPQVRAAPAGPAAAVAWPRPPSSPRSPSAPRPPARSQPGTHQPSGTAAPAGSPSPARLPPAACSPASRVFTGGSPVTSSCSTLPRL